MLCLNYLAEFDDSRIMPTSGIPRSKKNSAGGTNSVKTGFDRSPGPFNTSAAIIDLRDAHSICSWLRYATIKKESIT